MSPEPAATLYTRFVRSVATLSQQIRRQAANRLERSWIIIPCSTNTKCAPTDANELLRTDIQRLAANLAGAYARAETVAARSRRGRIRDVPPDRRRQRAGGIDLSGVVALLCGRLIAGTPVYDASLGGLHMLTLIGGLSVAALASLAGLVRRRLLSQAWVVLLLPLHWLLLSAAAWRGLLQLLREPYRWEKTEHGLANTSRMAQQAAPSARPGGRTGPTGTFANRPPPRRHSA